MCKNGGGGRGPGPGLRPGTLGLLKGNALSQNSYMIFGNAGDNGMDELCALRSHQNCGLIPNQLELGTLNVVIRYRSELCGIKCRHFMKSNSVATNQITSKITRLINSRGGLGVHRNWARNNGASLR